MRNLLAALLVATVPTTAFADDALRVDGEASPDDVAMKNWVVAEAPVTVGTPTAHAMPALGVYRDNGAGALGVRGRVGHLPDGDFGTVSLAMRRGVNAAWFELAGGAAFTGHGTVVATEIGAGWDFSIHGVDFGPTIRYERIDSGGMAPAINVALVGLQVYVGKHHSRAGGSAPTVIAQAQPAAQPKAAPIAPAPIAQVETQPAQLKLPIDPSQFLRDLFPEPFKSWLAISTVTGR